MQNSWITRGRTFLLVLSTGCCLSGCTQERGRIETDPPTENAEVVNQLAQLIGTYEEYDQFNGAALVAHKGKILYSDGHGLANREWDILNDSVTKFRIGSITKQFTAMLIAQLAAEEVIDFHESISTYLPEYPQPHGDQITIHQLLTHTSGIPNTYPSPPKKFIRPDAQKPEALVQQFSHLPLEFSPGEKFSYCNAGYVVLGLIIERMTGLKYEEALQERIFDPLEMHNTGIDKHRALIPHRADGYFASYGDYYHANYVDMSGVYAAGALYSTVEDLFIWDQALYDDVLIPEKYRRFLFTGYIKDEDYGGKYGYGWTIANKPIGRSADSAETISHDGVIDGFCAIITRIPDTRSTVILLSNVRRAPLNAMTRGIMGILYGKEYDMPRKSLAYSLLDVIETEGMNKGLEFFAANKANDHYYLVEEEMNIVSYKFLQSDRAPEAERVLRVAIEEFPEAFNLYDSLGEVLRKLGRTEESIANYRKSLQLNPHNTNGRTMLLEMGVKIEE